MKLYNMIEILQSKNKGKIIICNSGNFYIAVGKDAVLLNRILGLKVNCLKLEICKVGFPIIAVSGQQKDVLKPSKMRCNIKTSKF